MLAAISYTLALVLLALAAILAETAPYRERLAYAGLALWVLPTTVHALQGR